MAKCSKPLLQQANRGAPVLEFCRVESTISLPDERPPMFAAPPKDNTSKFLAALTHITVSRKALRAGCLPLRQAVQKPREVG